MTDMPILDKAQFSDYAKALLKNHNIIFCDGTGASVDFPENSPSELLAHSVFSTEKSQLVIRRNTTVVGGMIFQKNRCQTKGYKVVELISSSENAKELTPNHLAY